MSLPSLTPTSPLCHLERASWHRKNQSNTPRERRWEVHGERRQSSCEPQSHTGRTCSWHQPINKLWLSKSELRFYHFQLKASWLLQLCLLRSHSPQKLSLMYDMCSYAHRFSLLNCLALPDPSVRSTCTKCSLMIEPGHTSQQETDEHPMEYSQWHVHVYHRKGVLKTCSTPPVLKKHKLNSQICHFTAING